MLSDTQFCRCASVNNSSHNFIWCNIISCLIVLLPLLYYYIGPVSFLSYILVLLIIEYRFKIIDWVILSLVALMVMTSYAFYDAGTVMDVFRFHFGFVVFYLYFKYGNVLVNVRLLMYALCGAVFIEAILIHVLNIPPYMLPNYPDPEVAYTHYSEEHQRIYSFGANASVTSVLIVVVIVAYNSTYRALLFSFPAILIIGSGSGMIAWVVALIKQSGVYVFVAVFAFMLAFIYLFALPDNPIFNKLSVSYLEFLWGDKIEKIYYMFSELDSMGVLFGELGPKGGDFSLNSFFHSHGLLGLFVLIAIFFVNASKDNIVALFLLFFFSIHYQIIFSLPGQLLTGYILAIKPGWLGGALNCHWVKQNNSVYSRY